METLTPSQHADALRRFEEKYIPEPNSGCWLWTASTDRTNYGRLSISGRFHGAHRVAWMLLRGSIPKGLHILHKCDMPCCVNPDHLYPGTHSQNMVDAVRRGRLKPKPSPGVGRGKKRPTYWRGTSPRRGKFRAYTYIIVGGAQKQIYLGTFSDREEARRAVLRAESVLGPATD